MEFLALILFFIMMFSLLKSIMKNMLNLTAKESDSISLALLKGAVMPIKSVAGTTFGIYNKEGYMSFFDKQSVFASKNQGFVIDGYDKRLSAEASFENVLVTGATGLGKSSVYMYSNIFTLSQNRKACSLIITDPKAELYNNTSGYLKKAGYEVYSLNPINLSQSIFYNPLINCKTDQEIDEVARIIIYSANKGHIRAEDMFWINGAIKLLFIVSHTLIAYNQDKIINLPNLLHVLNNFGNKGDGIDKFVSSYASVKVYSMWKGLINANDQVLLSFLTTAQNALVSISTNNNVEKLLSDNSFDIKDLRSKKIAIFINIPIYAIDQMDFISNLFYTQMLNSLTSTPTKKDNDVFVLADEAGQFSISKLPQYTTILRSSRVGFMLLIQDIRQLEDKYGKNANTIVGGGIGSFVYFSATGLSTATSIEKIIGTKKSYLPNGSFIKEQIMPINKIVTMKKDNILFFHSTMKPTQLKVKKYFEVPTFYRYTKIKPFINMNNNMSTLVDYIDLGAI